MSHTKRSGATYINPVEATRQLGQPCARDSRMNSRPVVHVVDDEADVRDVVAKLVESVGLIAKSFASAQEFLAAYDGGRPGCIVLDVRMPGMTGIEALTRFAEKNIRLPVIMLTGYGDVPTAVRSLKRGAVDFIQKPFNPQFLLERIQASVADDASRAEEEGQCAVLEQRFNDLTAREKEILEQVIDGNTSKEIARVLGISDKTVDVHRTNIMRKVGAASVAELVKLAMIVRRNAERFGMPGADSEQHRIS